MNHRIKRLLAALIDYWIICFVSSAFIFIFTLGKSSVTPLSVTIYLLVVFTLLLTKDFAFKNASIGKRIFNSRIGDIWAKTSVVVVEPK